MPGRSNIVILTQVLNYNPFSIFLEKSRIYLMEVTIYFHSVAPLRSRS